MKHNQFSATSNLKLPALHVVEYISLQCLLDSSKFMRRHSCMSCRQHMLNSIRHINSITVVRQSKHQLLSHPVLQERQKKYSCSQNWQGTTMLRPKKVFPLCNNPESSAHTSLTARIQQTSCGPRKTRTRWCTSSCCGNEISSQPFPTSPSLLTPSEFSSISQIRFWERQHELTHTPFTCMNTSGHLWYHMLKLQNALELPPKQAAQNVSGQNRKCRTLDLLYLTPEQLMEGPFPYEVLINQCNVLAIQAPKIG